MTPDVRIVTLDAPLEDVVRLMERHHIKRLPVVEGGKIVGIVTRANLLHAMASFVHEVAPSSVEHKAIRGKILAELKTQPWASVSAVDVSVRNGVVQLSGTSLTRGSAKHYASPLKTFQASKKSRNISLGGPHFGILCRRVPAEGVSPTNGRGELALGGQMAWKRGSKSLRAPHVNLLPRRYSGSAKMKVLVSKAIPGVQQGTQ
jgi:CBS domain-containing protein